MSTTPPLVLNSAEVEALRPVAEWVVRNAPAPDGSLAAVARRELVLLWADLEDSIRMLGGYTPCGRHESLRDRIKALSDAVGPARWEDISIPFLLSETYARVCEEIGHSSQLPENERARLAACWDSETASRRRPG